jgi:hypothetical protein
MTEEAHQIDACPDGHHCLNGSKCAQNPFSEGSYYCDCQEADFEARYEGLKCEHKADTYCVLEESSRHSFCTNNGKCVDYVSPTEAHLGCICPPEYEGTYCQFLKGTKPAGWPYTSHLQGNRHDEHYSNAGAIAGIIVAVLAVGIILVAFWYRTFYVTGNYDEVAKEKDLELDCDGGILLEAVADQRQVPQSRVMNSRSLGLERNRRSKKNKAVTQEDERASINGVAV